MKRNSSVKSIRSVRNLKGKRVILRASLNVPIKNGVIQNDYRIRSIIPTLRFLKDKGAKTIVLSHLGSDGTKSLRDVARYMNKYIRTGFLPEHDIDKNKHLIDSMNNGGVFVLENIRRNPGELANSKILAKQIAKYGDIFVNDDFAVSHRKHASVDAITKVLPSYIGLEFEKELNSFSKVFKPQKPFVIILGGAKFETKLPLVKEFLKKADSIFIVGALANSFFRELGYEVGKSLVDNKNLGLKKLATNKKIILPKDVVVKNKKGVFVKKFNGVNKSDVILDNGPETVLEIKEKVREAKMILWNGPLGKFEDGFIDSTEEVAKAVSRSKAYSVVGGGDSVSAISKLKLLKKFNFVSTGGGAMLDYLADKTIPGLEALKKSINK